MVHESSEKTPFALFENLSLHYPGDSYVFTNPVEQVRALSLPEVLPALHQVEVAVQEGHHATGFVAYEAAGAFDPTMRTHAPADLPLLWFGIFRNRKQVQAGDWIRSGSCHLSDWSPSISREDYQAAFERIQGHITAGNTYQVNFTFRLRAGWEGEPFDLYRRMCRSQRAPYCAYLAFDDHRILSASPELFFELKDGSLACRPMKGTYPRGRWFEEDEEHADILRNSEKDRSENLMIVDLLRNDVGRISELGSVMAHPLFEVERYETVLQMTSTIRSRVRPGTGLCRVLAALFPCGSVTGAPKIRTMEIISETETSPRGIYTGCIGYVSPGPEALFNVAIRTLWLDEETRSAELGVGGGITHYSKPDLEYEECLTKARFVHEERPDFDLLESMLWEKGEFLLLDRHLHRMEQSAGYLGYPFRRETVLRELEKARAGFSDGPARVRLLLSSGGHLRWEQKPVRAAELANPYSVALCREPVSSKDPFLFHKTTNRRVYESRAALHPDCDDVILLNERGQITESTIANVVVVLDRTWWTPPVECGLLPGVFRGKLLHEGKIRERILYPEDLERSQAIYLVNSVRRAWRVQLVR